MYNKITRNIFQNFILLCSILLFSNCSGDYSDYNYLADSNSCFANESEILNAPGSSDAPKISISIGIESGGKSMHWSEINGYLYYELEESYCPDFSAFVNVYKIEYHSFDPAPSLNRNYYRVRAVLPDSVTGWSNVEKY